MIRAIPYQIYIWSVIHTPAIYHIQCFHYDAISDTAQFFLHFIVDFSNRFAFRAIWRYCVTHPLVHLQTNYITINECNTIVCTDIYINIISLLILFGFCFVISFLLSRTRYVSLSLSVSATIYSSLCHMYNTVVHIFASINFIIKMFIHVFFQFLPLYTHNWS